MLTSPAITAKYRVERLIGHGSFSSVYLATERLCDRHVAIKALRRDVYEGSTQYAESEIGAMARTWQHPNIVAIHTVEPGDDEYLAFIVMEYVNHGSLARRLRDAPLPYDEALGIVYDICRGLAFAHRQNVVHRDIKPRNILMTTEGTAKVSDFGVAQLREEAYDYASTFAGTRRYMAPEQYDGFYDHRVDVFSVGILLWEMLVGAFPYEGETQEELRDAKMREEPIPPSHLPPSARDLIATCLRRDTARRFRDMDAMFTEVERVVQSEYEGVVAERVTLGSSVEGLEAELAPKAAALRIEPTTARVMHELALLRHHERVQEAAENELKQSVAVHVNAFTTHVANRKYEAAGYELDRIASLNAVPQPFIEATRLCCRQLECQNENRDEVSKRSTTDLVRRAEKEAEAHLDAGSPERAALVWRENASKLSQDGDRRAKDAYKRSAGFFVQVAQAHRADGDAASAARYYQFAGECAEHARDKRLTSRCHTLAAECLLDVAHELERTQDTAKAAETYRLAARSYERARNKDRARHYYELTVMLLHQFGQKALLDGRRDEAESRGRAALELATQIGAWRLTNDLQSFVTQVQKTRSTT
jgi:hypothetical protein